MRSLFVGDKFPTTTNSYLVNDEGQVHHLLNVIRMKKGESLLLLDGRGQVAHTTLIEIDKKKIQLTINDLKLVQSQKWVPALLLAQTKKETMAEMLKMSVEIGVKKVYIFQSDFSPRYEWGKARLDALLISALEQSNQPYLPELIMINDLEVLNSHSLNFIVFHLVFRDRLPAMPSKVNKSQDDIVCIGPEGGWSEAEINYFSKNNAFFKNFPTSILRSLTALPFCLGWYLGTNDQRSDLKV